MRNQIWNYLLVLSFPLLIAATHQKSTKAPFIDKKGEIRGWVDLSAKPDSKLRIGDVLSDIHEEDSQISVETLSKLRQMTRELAEKGMKTKEDKAQ